MKRLFLTCAAVVALFPLTRSAQAQFFIGSPSGNFQTTSGTITNTPASVANNPNQEIDVNGQLIIQNATPLVQTATFQITCQLDPTYNGGTPLSLQLQINQSGFVIVPPGGNIYGWTLEADVIDNTGVAMTGAYTLANSPSPLYGPGTTTYGPTTTFGSFFTYSPAAASLLELKFTSNFDGLVPANSYTWDFPLTVQVNVVPEPVCFGLLAGCFLLLARRPRAH